MFAALEHGEVPGLVVSKVANFSIDLPEVAVAIQVSGTFGSRQEEAQRLGRVLRPKKDGRQAFFYSVVSAGTVEEDFALNRQRFLLEQGYEYEIADAELVADAPAPTESAADGGLCRGLSANGDARTDRDARRSRRRRPSQLREPVD